MRRDRVQSYRMPVCINSLAGVAWGGGGGNQLLVHLLKMEKKKRIVLCIIGVLFLTFPIWRQYIWWGYLSPSNDKLLVNITRKHYPLRHLQWSGIFPVYGGFIPDPHYSWSEVMLVPDSAARRLPSRQSQYQVVTVNKGFDDYSSEILLLISSGNYSFNFPLDFPKGRGISAIIAYPMAPRMRIFPYSGGLAFAANFFGPLKGIYTLSLPLKSGANLDFVSANNPKFEGIARELRNFSTDSTLKAQFCGTKEYTFITFYERYGGPCHEGNRRNVEGENRFNEIWLQDE